MSFPRVHLVPPMVKDLADQILSAKNLSEQAAYYERLRATRDYIDYVLVIVDHDNKKAPARK